MSGWRFHGLRHPTNNYRATIPTQGRLRLNLPIRPRLTPNVWKVQWACRWRSLCALVVCILSLAMTGCENKDAVLGVAPSAPLPGATISLQNDVQPIFDFNCATSGCHGSPTFRENLSLEEADTFETLVSPLGIVDVVSNQAPSLKRVQPFDSNASYLVNKIEGTAGSVGGDPTQMPVGGMLFSAEIQIIRDWIDQGALDN